jgi:formamidopyrimidine-DNA glycosylase
MPELSDVTIYLEALQARIMGACLDRARIIGPFLLRTATPPLEEAEGKTVRELRRVGKRIAIGLDGDLWLVLHLMIAGRLHWQDSTSKPKGIGGKKSLLAEFEFSTGNLLLTEAGSQRRASLHAVEGEAGLMALDPGGLEVLKCTLSDFSSALTRTNHTLKRALTDPRIFSGIGNAYSDEILHHARLSPVTLTSRLKTDEIATLFNATREVLEEWIARLRAEAAGKFPEKVTAFREGMAVHGRFGKPCPVCREKVQRIVYAENECNYCARCKTGGTVLADRALSRLLHKSFRRTLEDG